MISKKQFSTRSGLEGSDSHLVRVTRFKRLRYRWIKAVSLAIFLKILGINIRRVASMKMYFNWIIAFNYTQLCFKISFLEKKLEF
ncbi:MAG: transposase [Deltaproteobacteria bacterium]|nr:transposase [Deltaproteobacteria bacterium]